MSVCGRSRLPHVIHYIILQYSSMRWFGAPDSDCSLHAQCCRIPWSGKFRLLIYSGPDKLLARHYMPEMIRFPISPWGEYVNGYVVCVSILLILRRCIHSFESHWCGAHGRQALGTTIKRNNCPLTECMYRAP